MSFTEGLEPNGRPIPDVVHRAHAPKDRRQHRAAHATHLVSHVVS